MTETETIIVATLLFAVLGLVWLLPMALLGWFATRRRAGVRGAAGLLVFGLSASGSVFLMTGPGPHVGAVEALVLLLVAPPLRLAELVDARLWLALAVLAAGLLVAILALRRLRAVPALMVALALGLGMVPAAVHLQYRWSRAAMVAGAMEAGLTCHRITPLAEVLRDLAAPDPLGVHFGAFHGLGRKDEVLWVWSYRAAAWVPLKIRESQNMATFRGWLDC